MAKNLRKYMKTADGVFSRYIRMKDADQYGRCKCVTCGKMSVWNDKMDAGHFISRKDWPTRFDTRNVHPQCSYCNRYCEGKIPEYYQYMEDRYGREVIDDLIAKARLVKQYTLEDLKGWVKEWRAEIRKFRTVKSL